VPAAAHAAARELLLRELGRARLVAEVDWEARTISVLVASEWERSEWGRLHGGGREGGEKRVQLARAARAGGGGGGGGGAAPPLAGAKRPRKGSEEGAAAGASAAAAAAAGASAAPAAPAAPQQQPHDPTIKSKREWLAAGAAGGGSPPAWLHAIAAAAPATPHFRIILQDVFSVLPAPVLQDAPPFEGEGKAAAAPSGGGGGSASGSASASTSSSSSSSSSSSAAAAAVVSPQPSLDAECASVSTLSPVGASLDAPFSEGGGGGAPPSSAAAAATPSRAPRAPRAPRPRAAAAASPFTEAHGHELLLRVRYTAPFFMEAGGERGRRIFAGGLIPRGAAVCEYGGQLVRGEEGYAREDRYDKEGGAAYGCYSYFFTHPATRETHCVDATAERRVYGVGRLLSHAARAPNTAAKVVLVDGVPRLLFIAKCDVPFGSELLFDYGERRAAILKNFAWLRS
jgi:hypothetical protein